MIKMYELRLRQKTQRQNQNRCQILLLYSLQRLNGAETEGEAFRQDIQESYNQIVHWRRSLFKVPSEQAGKSFVRELTRMFKSYVEASALECVALQAAMVMPVLLLQKPHPKSKAKEHIVHLNRRLKQWMNGDIIDLPDEGRVIQQRLDRQHRQQSCEHTARIFAKLMMEGKVREALRLISEDQSGGNLSLDSHVLPDNPETVAETLLKKPPPGRPPMYHQL